MDGVSSLVESAEQMLDLIKNGAKKMGIETTRLMLQLYYVMKCPETLMKDKAIIAGALAYQLLPRDVLSHKKFGVLGLLDNGITLTVAYKKVKHSVTPEIEAQVESTLAGWFSKNNDNQ